MKSFCVANEPGGVSTRRGSQTMTIDTNRQLRAKRIVEARQIIIISSRTHLYFQASGEFEQPVTVSKRFMH